MREWDLLELEKDITRKKPEIDRELLSRRKDMRYSRRRPRSIGEQRVLDLLCINKWKKAEQEGKVKYLSAREWYYEFD